MNLIETLMDNKGSTLIEKLIGAGFGTDQAEGFLPDALKSVLEGLQEFNVQALMIADGDAQTASVMDKIDITTLAARLDGDNELASSGLQAIIPQILEFLKDNRAAASLLAMMSGKQASGLSGLNRGYFH